MAGGRSVAFFFVDFILCSANSAVFSPRPVFKVLRWDPIISGKPATQGKVKRGPVVSTPLRITLPFGGYWR